MDPEGVPGQFVSQFTYSGKGAASGAYMRHSGRGSVRVGIWSACKRKAIQGHSGGFCGVLKTTQKGSPEASPCVYLFGFVLGSFG